MARRRPPTPPVPVAAPVRVRPGLAVGLSIALLAGVGFLDYVTPPEVSCLFFYLAPVALATWMGGRWPGVALCIASSATSLAAELAGHHSLGMATWNAGIGLAVFLTVSLLLHRLQGHGTQLRSLVRTAPRICLTAAVCACLLGGGALLGYRAFTAIGTGLSGEDANAALTRMAADLTECMGVSRPVLLGSRDPAGPSCITIIKTGDVTSLANAPGGVGDLDGGPGTKIGWVFLGIGAPRVSPTEDFAWHQGRLKTLLENIGAANAEPHRNSEEVAKEAEEFSRKLAECTRWPAGFSGIDFSDKNDWPSFCLTSLNEAAARHDLSAAKRWAAELASATLTLADLHRWLAFLVTNHLTALEFQAKCESLFTWAAPQISNYDPKMKISAFPAGMMTLHGQGNYLEVERQAEQLFQMPRDRLEEVDRFWQKGNAAAVWMSPRLREVFLKLEENLSPENRRTWELAARTPYEHAYLANMLFRAKTGDMVEQIAAVLQRFNALKPKATLTDLMGVLMYRGHSFGGLEWADRYQPQLMQAAAELRGSDEEAFLQAYRYTYGFYRASTYGMTVTLRQAIEQRRMDCIRATDMIGDIYRDSGRTRLGHVRWSAGTNAHSVAAVTVNDGDQRKTLLLDGMSPMEKPEVWPDAYSQGHAWPPGLENSAPPYCMELYARGLDNYIWAEGYILRDVNAGTLMKAAVPYLPGREKNVTEKIATQPTSEVSGIHWQH